MDDSTLYAPLVATPEARTPDLPTEIIEKIFVSLMESYPDDGHGSRERSIKFSRCSTVSRLFHGVSKRNGYYRAVGGKQLLHLWGLFMGVENVAGIQCLWLGGNNATDLHIIARILLVAGSAPKLKRLFLGFKAHAHSGELAEYQRQRDSVMDALEGLKNIEMFDSDWIGFPNETALCRALSHWPKLRCLDLNEGLRLEEDDDDQPDLPACLAQLSSTSLLRFTDLTIGVETLARVKLVERILSFGRITDLSISISLDDPIELVRIESAVRKAAGRFKKFGNLTPRTRTSFILSLYPLLSNCNELHIAFWSDQTIRLPSSTQLPSLRTLSVYSDTQEHLELLGTFVLGRKTALDTLEIHDCDAEFDTLEEICKSVGTRLVRM